MSIRSIWNNIRYKTPINPILSTYQTRVDYLNNQYFNIPNFNFNIDSAKKIAAIMICSKILAQDIGRLPLKLYQVNDTGNKIILKDDLRYLMLHNHPNSYTDSYTFWSTVEYIRNIEGNSYVKINRNSEHPISLTILPIDYIINNVVVDGELYYSGKDEPELINASEILHFKNLSTDGLKGRDPKEDLNLNLSIAFKALLTIDHFYENGAITTMILETLVPEGVNPKEWQDKIKDFNEKYVGYRNANKTISLPPFTKLTPIPINFVDAEFINTIKYNNGQVAAYYGIPPHKIGNIESSKFNNLKEMQLDYLVNTIAPIITMYRRELELKLLKDEEIMNGYSIEFETNALNITDSETRVKNYKELFGMSSITPNQISKFENMESFDGGDTHYISTGYMSSEKANLPKEIRNKEIRSKDLVDWQKVYEEGGADWTKDLQPSLFAQEFAQELILEDKKTVLEIGCGNGKDSILFSLAGLKVTSIDLVPEAIKLAKENASKLKLNIDFQEGNVEKLSFKDNSFDAVYSLSVLHSTNMQKSLSEIYRILKSKGIAFIFIYSNVEKIDGTFKEFISVDKYIQLLKNTGFIISKFYEDKDNQFDSAGEKHNKIIVELKK